MKLPALLRLGQPGTSEDCEASPPKSLGESSSPKSCLARRSIQEDASPLSPASAKTRASPKLSVFSHASQDTAPGDASPKSPKSSVTFASFGASQEKANSRTLLAPAKPTGPKPPGLMQRRQAFKKSRNSIELKISCDDAEEQRNARESASSSRSLQDLYDVYEPLGQGSSGVVRRGVRKADKLEVAVKTMQAFDEEMVTIRRKEFELLRLLKHPNIVSAVDFFTGAGKAILVLEYFPSETLATAVKRSPQHKLSEKTCRHLFQMLLQAADCLHQHRIVHRDIKCDNILVSEDLSHLRLIDFNVARCMMDGGALTMTGTTQYQAPEVLLGESPCESSDVWSTGLCLHVMTTGALPWQSHAELKVSEYGEAILNTPLQLDGEHWKGVTDNCKEVLKLCLNLSKKLRPAPAMLLQHAWFGGSNRRRPFMTQEQGSIYDRMRKGSESWTLGRFTRRPSPDVVLSPVLPQRQTPARRKLKKQLTSHDMPELLLNETLNTPA